MNFTHTFTIHGLRIFCIYFNILAILNLHAFRNEENYNTEIIEIIEIRTQHILYLYPRIPKIILQYIA